MNDESYILENKDNVLLVEFPAFYDNLGEFELNITYHDENIEIEFSQIGCVYTHMLGDVDTKIAYLEELKKIAKECTNAGEFKEKVEERYPEYSGLNYLNMTAGFFFTQK